MRDLISVIIVNYNGKRWLKKCLDSLMHQTYKNFEIIFVDNASSDDSVEYVKEGYAEVKIIRSERNIGFAGGNNLGLQYAEGKYVVLLNNDTWAPAEYLEKFIQAFDEIPNLGSVQSKIVLMDDPERLDVCGSYWTNSSFLYHYGYGQQQELPEYDKMMPFFSNKGASMMLRKDIIDKIGLFDEDFWCYYEETDLCHRLWLSGYECWYYPKAFIYHAMGGTSLKFDNGYVQFHNFKNKLLSFLKNFEVASLWSILPVYLLLNMILSLAWLIQGRWKHSLALCKAVFWNMAHIRLTLKKRRAIQSMRKKTDHEFFSVVKRNPKMLYYYYLFKGKLNEYAFQENFHFCDIEKK